MRRRLLAQSHRDALRQAAALVLSVSGAAALLLAPGVAGAQEPAPAEPTAPPARATPPRPLTYVPPEYPAEAQAAGLEASVVLQLEVGADGKVTAARVHQGAGNGFDEAAVAAGLQLEFEPARRPDGTPAAARILYRYEFTLKPPEPPPPRPAAPEVPAPPAAPPEELRGTLLADEGDVPLAGGAVTIENLSDPSVPARTLVTNSAGGFRAPALGPGRYRVTVSAPGFEPLVVEEEIAPGEELDARYRLVPVGEGLEVVVRGERPPREVTRRTVGRREIARIPGTNGDALRSIQNLPGVARPPAFAGLLIVRGSAPQDTQTFIDGTPVPLIYHFGGLSSVVPTETLERIDFFPGNFGAEYGRVMGGIVDVGLRSPRSDGYHGLVQLDLIDARMMVEGPVPFARDWTFLAAGRRSHIDSWLGPALEAAGAGVTQAPVYYDYQFLVEKRKADESRFRVAFFGSDDALALLIRDATPGEPALSGNVGLHTGFQRLQVRYDAELSPKDRFGAVVALGHDQIDFGLGPFYFLLDVFSVTGRLEHKHRLSRFATINTGLDVFSAFYDVRLRAPAPPRPGAPPNQPFSTRAVRETEASGSGVSPAAYIEMELSPSERARVVPGVRLDYNLGNERFDLSPRVSGRYDVVQGFPRTTAKGGVGVYQQPPQFQESLSELGTPGLRSNRALHYSAGVEQELTPQVEVSAEGFLKQLDDLVVGRFGSAGTGLEYVNTGTGRVVGAEVLLKYKPDERFFGWAAYTLSRSTRIDDVGAPERLVPFDQSHILTVLGSYRLGGGWEFGARFRLVSGNLMTPNVCNPALPTCDPNRTNSLFHGSSGAYTPIPFSEPASERLPAFHQLDLRIDRRWKFNRWQLSAYLDVQNVYNNDNAEAIAYNYNFTTRQYVSGLPILPSLGLRGEF